jgi:hypothetical protein
MKIVAIGGTGLIGSKTVAILRQGGHEVVAASPKSGINTITGEGLKEAMAGAQVVIDLANSPSFEDKAVLEFFETAGRNLLAAEAAAGVRHHVALSIVGIDRTDNGYFRAKVAQEKLIEASGIPYTIIRATQFMEFLGGIADSSADGDICPHLTGRALDSLGLMRAQLWTWFVGMIVLTFPWHWVGILGMPRRMAFYDYTDPAIAAQAASVTMSVIGGAILALSGVLFFVVLVRGQTAPRTEPATYRFSVAVRPPRALPAALNGFGLWLGLMVALTIVNYGFPIAHSLATPGTAVPAVKVGERW